ncbi:BRO family protein [Kitasatospora phosalacinea]|uniref:BRO family protein n=1 Tax=Kitasatospora phosalacinea TaxID=2065 RepID=A0ABW6GRB8_9ACTN
MPYTFPETGTPVRVLGTADTPLFHHGDVCKILQHTNPTVAARMLDDDESVMVDMRDIAAGQTALNSSFSTPATGNSVARFVTEPGLYNLILSSRAPGAKAFRRWLTNEVLPSIRRTGSYVVAPAAPALPDLTTPQGVLALAQQFARTAEQLVEADAKLRELEPKALAHDTLMAAQDGDVLIREAAKALGWQEKQLRGFLLDEHLIYRRQATCGVTQYDFYAANAAHFNAVLRTVEHTWGSCAHYTLHVTPQGMGLIQKRIARRQAEMRDAIEGAA